MSQCHIRSDGALPDGLTLIPWHAGGSLTFDATVVCVWADSCVVAATSGASAIEELAAVRKAIEYANFRPINNAASSFFLTWRQKPLLRLLIRERLFSGGGGGHSTFQRYPVTRQHCKGKAAGLCWSLQNFLQQFFLSKFKCAQCMISSRAI